MKHSLFTLALFLFAAGITCRAQLVQQWINFYHDTSWAYDGSAALDLDSSGNVFVGGWSGGIPDPNYNDYLIIKYTNSGSQLWIASYDGTSGLDDKIYALKVTAGGDVIVTGSVFDGGGGWNLGTGKWSSAGALLWFNSYNGPFTAVYDQGNAIAIASDSSIYVCGVGENGAHHDLITAKYNPVTGARPWEVLYDGPGSLGEDLGRDIAVDALGNIFVTGESGATNTQTDYVTRKYNSSGVPQWTQRYNSSDSLTDVPVALAIDGAGNTYVTGHSIIGSSGNFDCVTIKYDAAGNEAWATGYDTSNTAIVDDRGYDLTTDLDGNILIAARILSSPPNSGWVIVKYDPNGNILWSVLNNTVQSGLPKKILTDQYGNVYIGGTESHAATSDDFEILKYDSAGVFQWELIVDGDSSGDNLSDFTLDNAGNIYVTGKSFDVSLSNFIILTAKYSQLLSVEQLQPIISNLIYPNPANENATIRFYGKSMTDYKLKIYDVPGREIFIMHGVTMIGKNEINIPTEHLLPGTYLINLEAGKESRSMKLIVSQ